MKPTVNWRPSDTTSTLLIRVHRFFRQHDRTYQPSSHYTARIKHKNAERRARLHVVR